MSYIACLGRHDRRKLENLPLRYLTYVQAGPITGCKRLTLLVAKSTQISLSSERRQASYITASLWWTDQYHDSYVPRVGHTPDAAPSAATEATDRPFRSVLISDIIGAPGSKPPEKIR
jgi:hypothetical protein